MTRIFEVSVFKFSSKWGTIKSTFQLPTQLLKTKTSKRICKGQGSVRNKTKHTYISSNKAVVIVLAILKH